MNKGLSLRAFNRLFPDEASARQWFEQARWLKMASRWECRRCDRQFTVTAGTPMRRRLLYRVLTAPA